MTRKMLIDATHPEETRVAVVDGRRLEEFDVEVASRKQLKGNIYLAKITRVEPSLQAAFVEYGGNRHGFLAFSEIHPDYYRIPVEDREALLAEQAALAREQDAEQDEADERARRGRHGGRRRGREEAPATSEAEPYATASEAGSAAPDETSETIPLRAAGDQTASLRSEFFEPADEAAPESVEPATEAAAFGAADPSAGEAAGGEVVADDIRDDEVRPEGRADEAPEHRAVIEETPVVAQALETIGGDEGEESSARRSRPLSRRYKIQDVIKRRQILLVQVTKEERGNKGAALTTYLSLAGRYCVLMPNTDRGGGVSRKITHAGDRKRLKSIIEDLEVPPGMAVIVRTAGSERSKPEVKRDFEYLIRLWDEIRELTLRSSAPALIYEEANLIKRAIRDLYTRDIEDIQVEGDEAYKAAKSFMRMLTPSHAKRVQQYRDPTMPLFTRYQIESQLDAIHNPVVQLKAGGYIVINQTEALVAIDVNSGRATRERNIEETALKTNLEAADEIARQLRLRDLAGLVVIDFIDMDEQRHNAQVERRLKEAMRHDRARIQLGRISPFGLLELSRQRLRPSLFEASTEVCRHCHGTGHVRSTESTALHVLRSIEEEGSRQKSVAITVSVPTAVALFVLNHKRQSLADLEARQGFRIYLAADDSLVPPEFRIERLKALAPGDQPPAPVVQPSAPPPEAENEADIEADIEAEATEGAAAEEPAEARGPAPEAGASEGDGERRRGRRRRRRGRDRHGGEGQRDAAPREERTTPASFAPIGEAAADLSDDEADGNAEPAAVGGPGEAPTAESGTGEQGRRRRRRGRRGGRRRRRGGDHPDEETSTTELAASEAAGESYGESKAADESDGESEGGDENSGSDDRFGEPSQPTERPQEAPVDTRSEAEVGPTPVHPPQPKEHHEPQSEHRFEPSTNERPQPQPEPETRPESEEPAGPRKRGWWQRVLS
jgi:ribonuclease E